MNPVTSPSPIQVLLVEDNPGDVRLTREALKDGKVCNALSVVHDGVEAMAFLRRQGPYAQAPRPDVILLDLNLPRKDGREVLAEVKADAELRDITVVVVTSTEEEREIGEVYSLPADCYVTKPVGLEQFVSVVRSVEAFWLTVVKRPANEPWYQRTDASIRIPLQNPSHLQANGSES
ncbi:MAG TPA: response regulator [Longimicrobium sp.]|nr:response regulator [Longimicrobium sp.]